MVSDKINSKVVWLSALNTEFPSVQGTQPGWAELDLQEWNHSPKIPNIRKVSAAKIGSKTTTNGHCLIWIISVLYSPPFPTYRKHRI